MSPLAQTIDADFKIAMKERKEQQLSTLRMLRTALKNREIDAGHLLEDEEVVKVIKSQMKQLRESMEENRAANREEEATQAHLEMQTLEKYLPPELSEEELEVRVRAALQEAGMTSKADMGKAMGSVMKALQGMADGQRIRPMVERLLE